MKPTLFLLPLLLGSPALAEPPPARPNVLVLFADDQRADTIAALGNDVIKTPNLDRLARSGLAFRRAYMQGGFQGATCVPSRAMLLSGQSLFHIDEKLQRDETWPAAFGRAGYETFLTGKWHNGPASLPRCFQSARAVFAGGMTNPLKAELSDLVDGKLTEAKPCPQHACAAFADEAIRFLFAPHEKPFFCYVPFDAPHDPHVTPPDFPVTYDPAKIPLPGNFLPEHPFDNGELKIRDELLLPHPRTPEQIRAMLADYYRYISYLDAQIGRVLEALEKSPHAHNTIIVFAADSGVARGGHGLIGKQNLYEDSIRVPLIVAGPGIPSNKVTDAGCYLFDVLPTLGKLCQVPAPKASEGHDLSAVLHDPTQAGRGRMVFAYRAFQRALLDGSWKLIRYPQVDKTQLFDLEHDPLETKNLADDPAQAERLRTMTAALAQELAAAGDLGKRPPPPPRMKAPPSAPGR